MNRQSLTALAMLLSFITPALAQETPAAPPVVAICYYAGLEYSQWAELPNGQICEPSGTWSYPDDQDPAGKTPEAAPAG
jgi:hypothetical protein